MSTRLLRNLAHHKPSVNEIQSPELMPDGMSRPVSLSWALGLEPVFDLASIVLRRLENRPTHPIWHRYTDMALYGRRCGSD